MLKIYVCGPTVYNDPHIGNLRPVITFDLSLKAQRALGNDFMFVHNITDIDDKIINRALEQNKSEKEIADLYFKKYQKLLKDLNIDTITKLDKVTDNLDLIIDYINQLILSENAYCDEKGNVWFDILKNKEAYGSVSKQKIDNMIFEDNSLHKKFKGDFALWKSTTIGIKFDSIFGLGRPGWHTECCALIYKYFKDEGVDIHGGGMDLTFPHHENENIQHYSLFKKPLTKKWLRCGQINLDGEKMSKSLGNVILADKFISEYNPTILKLIFMNAKVTANINITDELLANMKMIETKYKKVVFKILTQFESKDLLLDPNKNSFINQSLQAVANFDFSDFNFLINNEIKNFNKDNNIEQARNIYFLLSVFHPELTSEKLYKDDIKNFNEWRSFIDEKDYKKADEIRAKLMKKNII
ncbi:class I tRNA ligase family protein [Mycoplasmopsis primatum]|uniref:class I tRNA ligase family protein n=1 Tax=Mycoplasmopsis primatum TaxID=55604 RepID=UPI0004973065|nr:class I tRNA ligase family protein [Mycoplasmopsis primatum]